jgi:polar amino acid transport system substrate-binding protein
VNGITSRLVVSVTALALALAACGKEETKPVASPSPKPPQIPTVSIGGCQTAQGVRPAAEPKGVDYKTQLKEPGVLNVGSDNAYPPFEEIKPGARTPEGFDVDLYTEVAKRLGLTAKSTTTDFDGLFTQSIPNGTFDIGVSAITIKDTRRETVDFSVPYFAADLSLAVNVDKTPNLKGIDDLSGLTIGAQKGTTGEDCANVLVQTGRAKEVKSYADSGVAFQDLGAGRVAAIVNDRPASQGFIEKNASLRVVQVIETREQYGFAISREKPDLRVAIDEKLLQMMRDGSYAAIYQKWFGTLPPFVVPFS